MGRHLQYGLCILIILLVVSGILVPLDTVYADYDLPKVIRLHVVANSDATVDQELKNKVRDAVITQMATAFKASTDLAQARQLIRKNLPAIEERARQELAKYGKDYTVKAQLGVFEFPTKTYGNMTLAAGYYEALRITIGEGAGTNWWCVLYPPLCFIDLPHGLSANKQIDEKDLEKVPVEFRLKILEVAKNSAKNSFADLPHGLSANKQIDKKDLGKVPFEFRLKNLKIAKKSMKNS